MVRRLGAAETESGYTVVELADNVSDWTLEAGHHLDRRDDFQVPSDCYGDMMMTLVVAVGNMGHGTPCRQRLLWILTSIAMFLLNGLLQLGLSYILFDTTIKYSQEKYENGLPQRIDLMDSAMTSNVSMAGSSLGAETVGMCGAELASIRGYHIVYYMVIFLWYARMIQELSESMWICAVVWNVPALGSEKSCERDGLGGNALVESPKGRRSWSIEVLGGRNMEAEKASLQPGILPYSLTKRLEEHGGKIQIVCPCLLDHLGRRQVSGVKLQYSRHHNQVAVAAIPDSHRRAALP
mmetsp:Transcript_30873/g.55256  ORF Transcript_30873/g.55256 Transcript_30873/m.55256 type:complete len:295 (+) Transcript_30873:84-968(+)